FGSPFELSAQRSSGLLSAARPEYDTSTQKIAFFLDLGFFDVRTDGAPGTTSGTFLAFFRRLACCGLAGPSWLSSLCSFDVSFVSTTMQTLFFVLTFLESDFSLRTCTARMQKTNNTPVHTSATPAFLENLAFFPGFCTNE